MEAVPGGGKEGIIPSRKQALFLKMGPGGEEMTRGKKAQTCPATKTTNVLAQGPGGTGK